MKKGIQKTEEEWKKRLNADQFQVLRKKSTELPFTGKYLYNKEKGVYTCAGCNAELFSSQTKFDSGCGWPSFFEQLNKNIATRTDYSNGMTRIEIYCKKCGGHLGHVFDDGPQPTGKRYCVNSLALNFKTC